MKNSNTLPTRSRRRKIFRITGGIFIVILAMAAGAKPALKIMYGLHSPRVETPGTLASSAKKYGINVTGIVTIAPDAYEQMLKDFGGIPDGLVYNREGKCLQYKGNSKECNAGLFGFLAALDKKAPYRQNNSRTLNDELNKLRTINGSKLQTGILDTTADFYVLVSWADFTGKLNEDHVKVWQDIASANKKARIQILAVNCDIQQWWPKEMQDSIRQAHYGNF